MSRRASQAPALTRRSAEVTIAELLRVQRESHGPACLRGNLGDGFLYRNNPFFRRIRDAARARKIGFSTSDPGDYFAFPLMALDSVLRTRRVPYRDNRAALAAFERARPGFFTLADLRSNRPQPNYVLHESAHAVAFHELFGRPRDVHEAQADPGKRVHVVLGEAYAMTAEYFAACAVSGTVHDWFFSINSYRHRTPGKRAIAEFIARMGLPLVAWLVLVAFLENNFFVERFSVQLLDRALSASPVGQAPRLAPGERTRLARALSVLMVMNPEFREDTARLFFSLHGHGRNIRHILSAEPLDLIANDARLPARLAALVRILSG